MRTGSRELSRTWRIGDTLDDDNFDRNNDVVADEKDNDDDVLGVPREDTTEAEAVVGGNVKDENNNFLVGLILSVVVSASNIGELVMVSSGRGSSSS